jgi:glycerol uptake facilitator-like aquaporin
MAVDPKALDFTASTNDDPSKHIAKPGLGAMWIYVVGPFTGGLIAGLWNLFIVATE